MITKFDGSYAGHIDIENVGYGGTAVNDRRFSNEQLATVFDKGRDIAQLLSDFGVGDVGPSRDSGWLRLQDGHWF